MVATVILVIGVTIGIGTWVWLKRDQHGNNQATNLNLPPGPWGFPIIGHLPFVGKNPAVTFIKWAKIYGPIFSMKFGGFPTVVLNDAKSIREAFKLDSIAGRLLHPNFLKATDNKGFLLIDGPRQIEQKAFVVQSFKNVGQAKSDLEFHVKEEIVGFLKKLETKCRVGVDGRSETFPIHQFFQRPVLNSIWVSVMGWRFDDDDPALEDLTQILNNAIDTQSSALGIMCWYFPWIARALAIFGKNKGVNGLRAIYDYIGSQVKTSKENYVVNEPQSTAHAYFDQVARAENDSNSSFHKGKEQKFTMGDIFIGAFDTTSVSLDWLLLYMVREPHIQEKLQQEIDEVMGIEINEEPRPASLSDRPKMPYTNAVIEELLRISSISPLGGFHRATEDVNFQGYRIPKDTMVVANLYGIHHDPDIWPEPDSFIPERFYNREVEGSLESSSVEKPAAGPTLPFSFGKRICVGEGFARDQLFLFTTHFFQKFTVSCIIDKKPELGCVFGFVLSPFPFEIRISARYG